MRILAFGALDLSAAFKRIDPIRDGKTHEETGEGRPL